MTRAASELHLTQSAVSRTLQQLEEHLEEVLLDRSTHHVELTGPGQSLKDRAVLVIEEFDDLVDPRPRINDRCEWGTRGQHSAS